MPTKNSKTIHLMTILHSFKPHLLARVAALLAMLAACAPAQAHTVEWAIPPTQYYGLQFFRHGLYIFNDDSMRYAGIVDAQGNELYRGERVSFGVQYLGQGVSAIIDISTQMGKEIRALLFDDGHRVVNFPRGYFIKTPYITEGTLCVQNEQGRIGYIDIDGRVVVQCQFGWATPFRDGLALVRTDDGEWLYITRDWDTTHTPLKVEGGKITEACSFSNGHTFVKNKNGWVKIGTDGRVIKEKRPKNMLPNTRDYSEDAIRTIEITEDPSKRSITAKPEPGSIKRHYAPGDTLVGYSCQGQVFVPAQFWLNNDTEDFDGDYCVVMLPRNPRSAQGLLHRLDGNFEHTAATDTIEFMVNASGDTTITALEVECAYPTTLRSDSLHFRLLTPAGERIDSLDQHFAGGTARFAYQPTPADVQPADGKAAGFTYQVVADCNLLLWQHTVTPAIVEATPPRDTMAEIDILEPTENRVSATIANPESGDTLVASLAVNADGLNLNVSVATIEPGQETTLTTSVDGLTTAIDGTAILTMSNGQEIERPVRLLPPAAQPKSTQHHHKPKPQPKPQPKPKPKPQPKPQPKPDILPKR